MNLLARNNGELDELFRASPAGEIPVGDTHGTLLAFPGTVLTRPLSALVRMIFWQGKTFDPARGTLKNRISPLGLRAVGARVGPDKSRVDLQECILIDYSRTALLPIRLVRDEIRQVAPGEYLGVVWIGRRRVGWFTLRERGRL